MYFLYIFASFTVRYISEQMYCSSCNCKYYKTVLLMYLHVAGLEKPAVVHRIPACSRSMNPD